MTNLPRILDENLELIETIENFSTFIWTERWYSVGEFYIELSTHYKSIIDSVENLEKARYIYIPGQKYIGRVFDAQIKDKVMFITGYFVEKMLKYRYETANKLYKGTVSEVCASLVEDCAVLNKPYKWLSVAPQEPYGDIVSMRFNKKTVADSLYSLSAVYDCSHRISYDYDSKMLVYGVVWGKDRTQNQTKNEWCVFTAENGSILSATYQGSSTYPNLVTVSGSYRLTVGTDAIIVIKRNIVVEINEMKSENEDILQLFVDTQETNLGSFVGIEDATAEIEKKRLEMERLGYDTLRSTKVPENVNADVVVLKEHVFSIGDIVGVKDPNTGKVFEKRITEIKHIYDQTTEKTTVTFGDKPIGITEIVLSNIAANSNEFVTPVEEV